MATEPLGGPSGGPPGEESESDEEVTPKPTPFPPKQHRKNRSRDGEGDLKTTTVGELLAQRRPLSSECMSLSDVRPAGGPSFDLQGAEKLLRSVVVQTIGERSSVQIEVGGSKLDSLKIHLAWDGQRLQTRFDLSDAEQFKLVRSAVGELEEALRARGVPTDKVEVAFSSKTASGGDGQQERGREAEDTKGSRRAVSGPSAPSLLRRSAAGRGLA